MFVEKKVEIARRHSSHSQGKREPMHAKKREKGRISFLIGEREDSLVVVWETGKPEIAGI